MALITPEKRGPWGGVGGGGWGVGGGWGGGAIYFTGETFFPTISFKFSDRRVKNREAGKFTAPGFYLFSY